MFSDENENCRVGFFCIMIQSKCAIQYHIILYSNSQLAKSEDM